jgi:hypothetical protein
MKKMKGTKNSRRKRTDGRKWVNGNERREKGKKRRGRRQQRRRK